MSAIIHLADIPFRKIDDHEKIDNSFVSRLVNLTRQLPEIATSFLGEELPNHITRFELAISSPPLGESIKKRFVEKQF